MTKTFRLTIAEIGKNRFDGEAVSAILPGVEGVFQVLAGHEPLVAELKAGTVCVKTPDEAEHCFEIEPGGLAEVSKNQATVLL